MLFRSQTYGEVELEAIPERLLDYYKKNKHWKTPFHIIIGTDSQNYHDTKMVSVVAITCEGHGGIFFDHVKRLPRISSVQEKLQVETGDSLLIATKLIEILEKPRYRDLYKSANVTIHIDAGNSPNGKTASLIPALIGWVHATGLECKVKPQSFVASTIADKISK